MYQRESAAGESASDDDDDDDDDEDEEEHEEEEEGRAAANGRSRRTRFAPASEPSDPHDSLERSKLRADVKMMRQVARVQMCARAKRYEHHARVTGRPLATQPLEPALWGAALPKAHHIEYRSLPPRPESCTGRALFGWVPQEWEPSRDQREIDDTVCYECESGQEWKGNLILLCDGPGCDSWNDCETSQDQA